jgi:hypothetical protein
MSTITVYRLQHVEAGWQVVFLPNVVRETARYWVIRWGRHEHREKKSGNDYRTFDEAKAECNRRNEALRAELPQGQPR